MLPAVKGDYPTEICTRLMLLWETAPHVTSPPQSTQLPDKHTPRLLRIYQSNRLLCTQFSQAR